MKENLIICAHFDDELIGCSSILDKSDVLIICGDCDRREYALTEMERIFGCKYYMLDYMPFTIFHESQNIIADKIRYFVKKYKRIFTHNPTDLHSDHRVISDAVNVVARPEYSDFEILGYFYIDTDFDFNYCKKIYPLKYKILEKYGCNKKTIKRIANQNQYLGSKYNFKNFNVEGFKIVYNKGDL